MKTRTYLLDKLAEEAAEVAQAAIKHKHKRTEKSRRRLSAEVGQLLAYISAVSGEGITDRHTSGTECVARGIVIRAKTSKRG